MRPYSGGIDGNEKTWTFYTMCQPGVFDPTVCERLLPWVAFVHGATGLGLWSFADGPRNVCWNDYIRLSNTYSPVYFDFDHVTDSKHWEAIQEGVEDYQDLKMLKMQVDRTLSVNPLDARAIKAEKFLNDIDRNCISRMSAQGPTAQAGLPWGQDDEAILLDKTRLQALWHLTELTKTWNGTGL